MGAGTKGCRPLFTDHLLVPAAPCEWALTSPMARQILPFVPVLEAVPNVSEGRDLGLIRELVDMIDAHDVEVLDWSADRDHHRAVITFIGPPQDVEAACLTVARFTRDAIDLRLHRGAHPRVGALDVLPLVPLYDISMPEAVASAMRIGEGISELGVPVYHYGEASTPPGRNLAGLRTGGFEALAVAWPSDRRPDWSAGLQAAHPTAGATCVGARPVLLAWNVFVEGITLEDARGIAAQIRERGGGFAGLRALGLWLEGSGRIQVSMNLEDPWRTSPLDVFDRITAEVSRNGGEVVETEVIGMVHDTLVLPDSSGRLKLPDPGSARILSQRVAAHVAARRGGLTETSDLIV